MASLHESGSHDDGYQPDFNHPVKDFSRRAMFLIAPVTWPFMIYGPDRIPVPWHLFSRARELSNLFLPNAQETQAVLAIAKRPVQIAFIVRKLLIVGPIEDGKFILLAQVGRPLGGTIRFAVMLSGEHIPVVMPSSSLLVFVVLHCPVLPTVTLRRVGPTT